MLTQNIYRLCGGFGQKIKQNVIDRDIRRKAKYKAILREKKINNIFR